AAIQALEANETHYTSSLGLMELREAISQHYLEEYNVYVPPDQILVTSGTSPGFLLILSVILEPGDEVIVPEPYYPCYPNFIQYLGAVPIFVRSEPEAGFLPDVAQIKKRIGPRTKAIIINFPSNPTGQIIDKKTLEAIASLGLTVVSDEIYHGLVYRERCPSILEVTQDAFVLNGFSKRYAMTGWRLGYVIAPNTHMREIQKLQQNFLISANSISQRAAISALRDAREDLIRMLSVYDERRTYMVKRLRELGFYLPIEPKGAFYIFCDLGHIRHDSVELVWELLEDFGVAVTPGGEFGTSFRSYVRFSYANSLQNIEKGLNRIEAFLNTVQWKRNS
ncbi:MAG: pyridoxal phosphate-dependent aminotransferase, partial [Desulfatiglandales bacterium]